MAQQLYYILPYNDEGLLDLIIITPDSISGLRHLDNGSILQIEEIPRENIAQAIGEMLGAKEGNIVHRFINKK